MRRIGVPAFLFLVLAAGLLLVPGWLSTWARILAFAAACAVGLLLLSLPATFRLVRRGEKLPLGASLALVVGLVLGDLVVCLWFLLDSALGHGGGSEVLPARCLLATVLIVGIPVAALALRECARLQAGQAGGRARVWWAAGLCAFALAAAAAWSGESLLGGPPLIWAAKGGHERAVRLLLDLGADANARDESRHGAPPLIHAIWRRDARMAELLLARGADPLVEDAEGWSAVRWTYQSADAGLLRLLVDRAAARKAGEGRALGDALMVEACQRGDPATLRLLLDRGLNPNARAEQGKTVLMMATERGQMGIASALIAKGAALDARNDYGDTALLVAVLAGRDEMIGFLLDRGADPNARRLEGSTPLIVAGREGKLGLVRLLIGKGATPDTRDAAGRTALMWASEAGHEGVVILLLEKGADVGARDEKGRTALDVARAKKRDGVIRLLVARGAGR